MVWNHSFEIKRDGGIEEGGGARNDRKGTREANLNSCHNLSTYKAILLELLELVRATASSQF